MRRNGDTEEQWCSVWTLVDNREKSSLLGNLISDQSREKGFFIGAASKCDQLLRCLRLVQIYHLNDI